MDFINNLVSSVKNLFSPQSQKITSPLSTPQQQPYNQEARNPGLENYYQTQARNEQVAGPIKTYTQPTMQPTQPIQHYAPVQRPIQQVQGTQASPPPQITSYQPSSPQVSGYQQNITIPYSQNGAPFRLNPQLAQTLMNAFDKTGQATNAATVLNHPKSQTYTPQNIAATGHKSYNYGENAGFKTQLDVPNSDGSIDRGLFRINNNTFNGMKADPYWSKAMTKYGISNWDDMNDPQKNAYMANLIQQRQGWNAWFAAPLNLKNY